MLVEIYSSKHNIWNTVVGHVRPREPWIRDNTGWNAVPAWFYTRALVARACDYLPLIRSFDLLLGILDLGVSGCFVNARVLPYVSIIAINFTNNGQPSHYSECKYSEIHQIQYRYTEEISLWYMFSFVRVSQFFFPAKSHMRIIIWDNNALLKYKVLFSQGERY